MAEPSKWRAFWDQKSSQDVSDYEFDRGANPRPSDIEDLSAQEFLEFVCPAPNERLLDAGCGTGENILRLHDRVLRIVAMDFSDEAVARCRRRVQGQSVQNAEIHQGSITEIPLPDRSVDKIICMSVLHYLNDDEVRTAFREFARVLAPQGTLILHVKNSASLYLATLRLAKRLKSLLGASVKIEHFRPFGWYDRELASAGFRLEHYNSFNILMIEGMPRSIVHFLQRLELRHYKQFPLKFAALRRLGADLKLKALVR